MGSLNEAESFLSHKFTHIVVGGGTAGLVVAVRLSENPALTVGILEAGPVALDEPSINVPGRLGETLFTKYDWQFETTPQPGFSGRKLAWNRGKVLGGSSALNFMMWTRGSKEDYDAWEKLGNKGWGWEGMLSVESPHVVCSFGRLCRAVAVASCLSSSSSSSPDSKTGDSSFPTALTN